MHFEDSIEFVFEKDGGLELRHSALAGVVEMYEVLNPSAKIPVAL